jgi:hypothetical protein
LCRGGSEGGMQRKPAKETSAYLSVMQNGVCVSQYQYGSYLAKYSKLVM